LEEVPGKKEPLKGFLQSLTTILIFGGRIGPQHLVRTNSVALTPWFEEEVGIPNNFH